MKKLIAQGSLLIAPAIWTLLNWPGMVSLHARWIKFDEPYAIGYPVVLIAVWLIFESRRHVFGARVLPSLGGLVLFLLAAAITQAAGLVQFQLLQQVLVPVSLWLLLVSLTGWRIGRLVLFPFALIYLAIPLWDALVDPLRWLTVVVTQRALNIAGIPAYISGYEITLPDGIIAVEDGCSGLNLLLSAVVVGALQFHLMARSLWRRSAVAALAVGIGIIDNWIRVVIIVLVGHFSHMQSSLVYHHGNFGWAVFVVSLVPFFVAVHWLDRGNTVTSKALPEAGMAKSSLETVALYAAITALGAIILLQATTYLERREGKPIAWSPPRLATPAQPQWLPHYSGFDQQQAWRADVDGAAYEILALTYLQQTANKKLIYFSNRIADERHTLNASTVVLSDTLRINQTVVDAGGPRLVWWFYLINNHVAIGGMSAKWNQLIELLHGNQHASLIAISTRCDAADCSDFLRGNNSHIAKVHGLLSAWAMDLGAKTN